ncbi:unnamed protein product [Protopolystoma xenopodis]|uniref:Bcl-2 Bcl-2 homology region 1-3 domain-containing protein n=1 Tax=Protopolystoma xenopodis TaxID=117903 RepID=A0A3S5BXW5_9PLAT|nr:unnamed protein product [Protopolystoma xenopodis]
MFPNHVVFVESAGEKDSNIYNPRCSLDELETKTILEAIIVDYVVYLMSTRGYNGLKLFTDKLGRTAQDPILDTITRQMIHKAEEFRVNFLPRFENRKALLHRAPERAQLDFMDTVSSIWKDGMLNWGRLLGYMTFVADYCMTCLDAGIVFLINFLVEYAVKDLDSQMGRWIIANGGWRGFMDALETLKTK